MVSWRRWGKRGTGLQGARSGSRVGFAGCVRGSSAAQARRAYASRGGAADEDRISRGVEAGRSVPGGVYGRMFGGVWVPDRPEPGRFAPGSAIQRVPKVSRLTPGRPYGPLRGRFRRLPARFRGPDIPPQRALQPGSVRSSWRFPAGFPAAARLAS